jgi:hypothetical protein
MFRLAYTEKHERIELHFLPSEEATAKAMAQDAANRYGHSTLMHFDAKAISVVGKFSAKARRRKVVGAA